MTQTMCAHVNKWANKKFKNLKKENKMKENTMYLSTITQNVSGLNSLIIGHTMVCWIKKQGPTICCFKEMHLTRKDKYWLRAKGWKRFSKQMEVGRSSYIYIW
jgi:hypothetical protein